MQNKIALDVTYSVTILTSVNPEDPHPVVMDMRQQTNSSRDFLEVVTFWIKENHLVKGNYFID